MMDCESGKWSLRMTAHAPLEAGLDGVIPQYTGELASQSPEHQF